MDFAGSAHRLHQGQCFRGDGKCRKTCGKAGHAQDAHRVFAKGRADVAEDSGLDVGATIEGVDDVSVIVDGHGVDGEVPSQQVFFQGHVRREMHVEPFVARGRLALGAGQCIFLVGLGVQKDRKILADGPKTAGQHLFGCGAHHHPVTVTDGQA